MTDIEILNKISSILNEFNQTFKLKIEESKEQEINSFSIEETIGDGKDFINEFVELFEKVIEGVTDEYALVYDVDEGLVLAKKVQNISYSKV